MYGNSEGLKTCTVKENSLANIDEQISSFISKNSNVLVLDIKPLSEEKVMIIYRNND